MRFRRPYAAFPLIELLVVFAIIGVLAAIIGPSITGMRKGDAMLAGTRQMADAVSRARQLAISQRTTVYMVFVPPNFWADPAGTGSWSYADKVVATNLAGKQLIGYN